MSALIMASRPIVSPPVRYPVRSPALDEREHGGQIREGYGRLLRAGDHTGRCFRLLRIPRPSQIEGRGGRRITSCRPAKSREHAGVTPESGKSLLKAMRSLSRAAASIAPAPHEGADFVLTPPQTFPLLRRKKGGGRLHRPPISRAERLGGSFADAKTRRAAKDCASDDHASRHVAYRTG